MKRWITVLVLAALLCSGCETIQERWNRNKGPVIEPFDPLDPLGSEAPALPEPGLPLAAESRFRDIPLPEGLRQDLSRTFVYESSTLQIGRMVYTSKASVSELAAFFLRECPAAEWQSTNVIEADGAQLLFTKPGKQLIISIRDLGLTAVTRGRQLVLTLTPTESAGSGL